MNAHRLINTVRCRAFSSKLSVANLDSFTVEAVETSKTAELDVELDDDLLALYSKTHKLY